MVHNAARLVVGAATLTCLAAASPAQDDEFRGRLNMEFRLSRLTLDNAKYNALVPGGLPALGGPVELHGGRLSIECSEWLNYGFQAFGALSESETAAGYTSFRGAYAGFYLEAKKRLATGFFAEASVMMGCGDFSFESINTLGSTAVYGHSNDLLMDLGVGLSYMPTDAMLLRLGVNTVVSLEGDSGHWVGTTTGLKPFPAGLSVYFSLGVRFK